METVEFRTDPAGPVYYKVLGREERRLTKFSHDIVQPLYDIIKERFPICFNSLVELYGNPGSDNRKHAFPIVERFIRCNFGEHDLLTQDIEHDILHFEQVKCPLRGGFCPYENVICNPRGLLKLSQSEKDVAHLYIEGLTFKEIADRLGKTPSTVKVQLLRIRDKLKVKNCREIIRVLRLFNFR